MSDPDREIMLHELEAKCREVAKILGDAVPDGVGFCLQLFTFGEGGWMTYVSNAKRPDMMKAMREMLEKLEADPNG